MAYAPQLCLRRVIPAPEQPFVDQNSRNEQHGSLGSSSQGSPYLLRIDCRFRTVSRPAMVSQVTLVRLIDFVGSQKCGHHGQGTTCQSMPSEVLTPSGRSLSPSWTRALKHDLDHGTRHTTEKVDAVNNQPALQLIHDCFAHCPLNNATPHAFTLPCPTSKDIALETLILSPSHLLPYRLQPTTAA